MTVEMNGIRSMAAGQGAIATYAMPPPRLVRAAHEFEAQLMKELLRPMTESGSLTGDDDGDGRGGAGTLGEFASESPGRSPECRRRVWNCKPDSRRDSRSGNNSKASPVTGMYNIDTGISAHK
jgi:hypothetical protein